MAESFNVLEFVRSRQHPELFQELTWSGSFQDYINIVVCDPKVTRTAFQRLYDMILSHGVEEYVEFKKKILRYKFFDDPFDHGTDAIFGLEVPLMKMVGIFKAAAQRFGTEKRVLLLHGPVGSSKSTIVRLLKKGIEHYSRTREGALYTFSWHLTGDAVTDPSKEHEVFPCPMNEEPLVIIPEAWRAKALQELGIKTLS